MNYWIESSDEDYEAMKVLFDNHKILGAYL